MAVDKLSIDMVRMGRVKAYIGNSVLSGEEEPFLQEVIHAVSSWCANFCGRDSFMDETYTHDATDRPRLSGQRSSELLLKNTPIRSITTLKRRFDEDALTEGPSDDFTFDPWTGLVTLTNGRLFPETPEHIEIVYVGGYADEDATAAVRNVFGLRERASDLSFSVLKMCAVMYHRRKRERDGIVSMSTEGGTFTFDTSSIPADVLSVWQRYQHRKV